jgi:hypothetical protein
VSLAPHDGGEFVIVGRGGGYGCVLSDRDGLAGAGMICEHPDCFERTADQCGACGLPFCARHLHPDKRGRCCATCLTDRWRTAIRNEALILVLVLLVGPIWTILDTDAPTKRDLEVAYAIFVVCTMPVAWSLWRKYRSGPPLNGADHGPRR